MKHLHYQDELTKTRNEKRLISQFSIGLAASNLLLGFCLWVSVHHESAWLVPMDLHTPVHVTDSTLSVDYLNAVASSFVSLRLNFTPETIEAAHQAIEQYLAPGDYAEIGEAMKEEIKSVTEQKITSSFSITQITPDIEKNQVMIAGVLTRSVGDMPLKPARARFLIVFKSVNGLLQVTTFKEVKDNA